MIRVETTAGVLNQIFRPVNAISESCKVRFNPEGIHIPGADPLNLAAVDVEVGRDAFDRYEADGALLGIHFEKLMKILGSVDPSDTAHLHLDTEKRLLELQVGHKKFILGLVQLDAVPTQPHIPDVAYPVQFSISQLDLADTIETAKVFADEVAFEISDGDNYVTVRAQGDIDRTIVKLNQGEELEFLETSNVKNSFSINLLDDAVSVIPDNKSAEVELAHDRPIVISYNAIQEEMDVTFTLAPWKEVT